MTYSVIEKKASALVVTFGLILLLNKVRFMFHGTQLSSNIKNLFRWRSQAQIKNTLTKNSSCHFLRKSVL